MFSSFEMLFRGMVNSVTDLNFTNARYVVDTMSIRNEDVHDSYLGTTMNS